MVILDEVHTVTATIDGVEHRLTRANLNGDVDTVDTLRSSVLRERIADDDAVRQAFDEAFEACERIPGDGATGTSTGDGFVLTIRRSLEG